MTAELAAATAHADQIFASAEKQLTELVRRMDESRALDPDGPRVEQWLPLAIALSEFAPGEAVSHFLAAAILRLSEAKSDA